MSCLMACRDALSFRLIHVAADLLLVLVSILYVCLLLSHCCCTYLLLLCCRTAALSTDGVLAVISGEHVAVF